MSSAQHNISDTKLKPFPETRLNELAQFPFPWHSPHRRDLKSRTSSTIPNSHATMATDVYSERLKNKKETNLGLLDLPIGFQSALSSLPLRLLPSLHLRAGNIRTIPMGRASTSNGDLIASGAATERREAESRRRVDGVSLLLGC